MGFGILFIGYLLLVEIPFFGGFDLSCIGYGIMLRGLRNLGDYEDGFRRARYPAYALLPLSLYLLLGHFFPALLPQVIEPWLLLLHYGIGIAYQLLLLTAMETLASEVEQPKNAAGCRRCRLLVLLYLLGLLLLNLPIPSLRDWITAHPRPVLIFSLCRNLIYLLVSRRIFICFRDIAPAGEDA